MKARLRILVVSYTFPPQGEVGTIRVAQLCRYLPHYGIEPVVLSVQENFYETRDDTLGVPIDFRVLRTRMLPNPLEWYGKLRQRLKGTPEMDIPIPSAGTINSNRSGLRNHILAFSQFPDPYWGWYFPAIHAGEQFLRQERVDAIFSSGPPWISHLVARHLKRKFALPWLADFRDPWATLLPEQRPSWWHHLMKRIEENCMQLSDLVLCNTERLCQAFRRQYPKLNPSKFRTLTNGYEYMPIHHIEKKLSARQLLHLGSIYGLRRVDAFWAAISNLVAAGRLRLESFKIILQGDNSPSVISEAANTVPTLLQSKSIEFRPRVSWAEAWKLLWEADLLLLFQGTNQWQVPAKFYEYLQTGIPMFAVTEEGALTDILQATESGVWAHPNDPQEIADKLLAALQLSRRPPEYVRQRFSAQYHYSGRAEQLSEWIKEIVSPHS